MEKDMKALIIHVALALCAATAAADDKPTAYVFEHVDQWTKSAMATPLLEQAGFDVQPLPLDRSPFLFDVDLIVIGSFASEHPRYGAYLKDYAADLFNYVDKGHTLLQLTQADQVEREPPFLPTTHGARRNDLDTASVDVCSPSSPLLRGVDVTGDQVTFATNRTAWEAFDQQGGFEVILSAEPDAKAPVLMEGAYGQGRIILAAMALDKANMGDGAGNFDQAALDAFRTRFFSNLAEHVVNVRNRTTEPLEITPSAMFAARIQPGSWTLAVLPDTQVYSLRFPGLYTTQTGWIVENRDRLNIKYVLHLGDIVNNNSPYEWRNARDAMSLLDGVVPYALAPGNHDYGPSGDASTRDTLMNDYFHFEDVSSWPTFGGAYEDAKLDNTYHLFEAGGQQWIIIALEWGPRNEVVEWANQVMKENSGRLGIMITHAYMNNNDLRYDHTDTANPQHYNPHEYRTPGPVNDGEELWRKLISKHDFRLVLNGHVLGDGTGYLVSDNVTGAPTHQMLSNYQMRNLGGEGYMRLLEFRTDGSVVVKSYSPLYDSFLIEPDQLFEFQLDAAQVDKP
jgi:3',5'-cyclic AMP phosphodiesterase CpdA